MIMSPACEAPIQPASNKTDHPKYQEWMRYRSACAAQLVTASTFDAWLDSIERREKEKAGLLPYQIVNAHPRGEEYWAYSRSEYSAGRDPLGFEDWLNG